MIDRWVGKHVSILVRAHLANGDSVLTYGNNRDRDTCELPLVGNKTSCWALHGHCAFIKVTRNSFCPCWVTHCYDSVTNITFFQVQMQYSPMRCTRYLCVWGGRWGYSQTIISIHLSSITLHTSHHMTYRIRSMIDWWCRFDAIHSRVINWIE